ncbi:hypothetical protein Cgig2_030728 [Carnegiea gigantea]|uniref:Uncharacterized protein n=1 Tax=Carnegiea gigantea TaxID=171969 RepID=A0A9Q1QNK9_9CARY|nr:hypothetical protein Cgig2_030728 [Carnegiea gigantea]
MADFPISMEKIKQFWHSQVHDESKWDMNMFRDEEQWKGQKLSAHEKKKQQSPCPSPPQQRSETERERGGEKWLKTPLWPIEIAEQEEKEEKQEQQRSSHREGRNHRRRREEEKIHSRGGEMEIQTIEGSRISLDGLNSFRYELNKWYVIASIKQNGHETKPTLTALPINLLLNEKPLHCHLEDDDAASCNNDGKPN